MIYGAFGDEGADRYMVPRIDEDELLDQEGAENVVRSYVEDRDAVMAI